MVATNTFISASDLLILEKLVVFQDTEWPTSALGEFGSQVPFIQKVRGVSKHGMFSQLLQRGIVHKDKQGAESNAH